jgi:hypothetical protein
VSDIFKLISDMEEDEDIFDDMVDDDIDLINVVADVQLIADIQAVDHYGNAPQVRLFRNPVW